MELHLFCENEDGPVLLGSKAPAKRFASISPAMPSAGRGRLVSSFETASHARTRRKALVEKM